MGRNRHPLADDGVTATEVAGAEKALDDPCGEGSRSCVTTERASICSLQRTIERNERSTPFRGSRVVSIRGIPNSHDIHCRGAL